MCRGARRFLPVLLLALGASAALFGARAAEAGYGEADNEILALVLRASFQDGGYTVVNPETTMGVLNPGDAAGVRSAKQYLLEQLKIQDYDPGPLLDLLFARNADSVRLTLPSAPQDGYLIDYDGRFARYFAAQGGGWERWRAESPKAHGWTEVSLPALDAERGIVLVYRGTLFAPLAGSGHILAFRYEKGELRLIGEAMMWIS